MPATVAIARDAEVSVARLMDIALLLLLICTQWNPAGADSDVPGLITYLRYALFGGLGLAVVCLAALESGKGTVLVLPAAAAMLVLYLGYTCLSVGWSDGFSTSLIKAGLIGIAMMAALAAATTRPVGALLRQAVLSAAIFVAAGALVAIFMPSVGVETGWLLEGKWRGISGQKNGFGAITALVVVALVAAMLHRRGPDARPARVLILGLLVLSGFCLLMSGSRGAQMICMIGLVSIAIIHLPMRLQNFALLLACLVALPLVPLGMMTFHANATDLGIFGLSFDTSSRTQIWAYGLENFAGRELFGFGVSGFWTSERMEVFKADNGWVLDNFHNGYVTILIEGGIVGIGSFLAVVVLAFMQLRQRAYRATPDDILAFAVFNMLVALNLVENEFGRSTSFFFILFLLVVFSLARRIPAPSRRTTLSASPLFTSS